MTGDDSEDPLALVRAIRYELRAARAEVLALDPEGARDLPVEPEPTPDPMRAALAILAETRRELEPLAREQEPDFDLGPKTA
jgi:hypothetical protein